MTSAYEGLWTKTEHELWCAVEKRLLEKGWRQNGYGSIDGPNCLIGAMAYAAGTVAFGVMEESEAARRARAALPNNHHAPRGVIVDWNDDIDRTFADVLGLVRRMQVESKLEPA